MKTFGRIAKYYDAQHHVKSQIEAKIGADAEPTHGGRPVCCPIEDGAIEDTALNDGAREAGAA